MDVSCEENVKGIIKWPLMEANVCAFPKVGEYYDNGGE
jgi:hypothetical protein